MTFLCQLLGSRGPPGYQIVFGGGGELGGGGGGGTENKIHDNDVLMCVFLVLFTVGST